MRSQYLLTARKASGADAEIVALFNLLEHRIRLAGGEDIARQQQQRNAVGAGGAGGGDHVGRPGPMEEVQAIICRRRPGGQNRWPRGPSLLVAPLIDAHIAAVLLQRLPQPQDVAMAENRENAFHELQLYAIHFRYWLSRNFTSACAVVSLSLPDAQSLFSIVVASRRCRRAVVHVTGIPVDYRQTFFIKYKYRRNISFCEKDQTLPISYVSLTFQTRFRALLPHQTAISP